ncbi:PstS family phosphate ABC transporter substrate-binding protein [Streptacidiphilus jiangxiensis]|uniref:ABC-type phosphate transport system, substrate-binding protein n=1 Tax=Streptacidiphilus jiangxiensis TaxID=235985 RepID=A0A1H7YGW3_STRJI|nr:substrate-binding domain-containing protein [Streptacidiphilus jiangxiensis]SEM44558.1 ABC-type phosphate transport system, substrate-binding protein [Streptacidiphilus jiangxiensis]
MLQLASALDTVNAFIDGRGVLGALVVAGVTTGAGLLWRGRRPVREISWSVEYDQPLNQGQDAPGSAASAPAPQPKPEESPYFWDIQFRGEPVLDGSLVLLRVRSTGSSSIDPSDFVYGLSFEFPDREVLGFKVRDNRSVHKAVEAERLAAQPVVPPPQLGPDPATGPSTASTSPTTPTLTLAPPLAPDPTLGPDPTLALDPTSAVPDPATATIPGRPAVSGAQGRRVKAPLPSKFVLPTFQFNRGTEFRLLVLLQGDARTKSVQADGELVDGRIVRHDARRPPLRLIAVGASLAVLIAVLTLGVRIGNDALTPTASCAEGRLTLQGSSAFAPVANQVRNSYRQLCGNGVTIDISADGSDRGLGDLERSHSSGTIAMSDGLPASATGTEGLTRRPVGVVSFAVVANTGLRATLPDLFTPGGISADELRALFSGSTGSLAPGLVAVGRTHSSGTRTAFAGAFFGGTDPEPQAAPACSASTRTGFCASDNTMDLLSFVNSHPNAIGYAEADALPYFPDVQVVAVDGQTPSTASVVSGAYPFVATEYLYSADRPAGLVADFLDFLTSPAETAAVRGHGFIACTDLRSTKLDGACAG